MSLDLSGSYQDLSASTLSFQNQREYEASKILLKTRSDNYKPHVKNKQVNSVWDLEPIDFSVKHYHPKPPKRNSREAIKPWTYDKYLKKIERSNSQESEKISAENTLVNSYLIESFQINNFESEIDFQKSFRSLTPNGARIEASKNMGFREGLDQYKNPQAHDFRGLKPVFGTADFRTRFEKDPYNIKFLSGSLNQITGLGYGLSLRETDPGLQMGDKVKKAESHYDPNLILPRLPFPNKFNGYSRYRNKDRSIESAFWDRVLPRLSDRLNDKKFSSNKELEKIDSAFI